MRIDIEIDEKLTRRALAASGLRTKRAEALRLLLRLMQQKKSQYGIWPAALGR